MEITRQFVEALQAEDLEVKQRLLADLNAVLGRLELLHGLLTRLDLEGTEVLGPAPGAMAPRQQLAADSGSPEI